MWDWLGGYIGPWANLDWISVFFRQCCFCWIYVCCSLVALIGKSRGLGPWSRSIFGAFYAKVSHFSWGPQRLWDQENPRRFLVTNSAIINRYRELIEDWTVLDLPRCTTQLYVWWDLLKVHWSKILWSIYNNRGSIWSTQCRKSGEPWHLRRE